MAKEKEAENSQANEISDDASGKKKVDRMCLRVLPEISDWLIIQAAKEQIKEKRIVAVQEYLLDIMLERYGMPLPDRHAQRLSLFNRVTYVPVMLPGLREAMDAERQSIKNNFGDDVGYADLVQDEVEKRRKGEQSE